MCNVKIYGAGSIGNHLANAARMLGWNVTMCDIDEDALNRTKTEIYPQRYGEWDDSIELCLLKDEPKDKFDYIFIGTPPDSHIPLALNAIKENPKAILIEKPVCQPDLSGAKTLYESIQNSGVKVFVGYDHVVGNASQKVAELISKNNIGNIESIDVEFREHWGGIFVAHPWLDGAKDTYLGFWKRGGGACGEHSHAINLWQYFAAIANAGKVTEVNSLVQYVTNADVDYDKLCAINLKTENNIFGRVVQDVITKPPRKWARIQGENGFIEWQCGYKPGCDIVRYGCDDKYEEFVFEKTRPDDFICELKHIENSLSSNKQSGISLENGLDTMLIVAAAHKSAALKCNIAINNSAGYTTDALLPGVGDIS